MSERFILPDQTSSDIIEVGHELEPRFEEIAKLRIKPETFRGVKFFTDEEIDRDLAFVEEAESKFSDMAKSSPEALTKINMNAQVIEMMLPLVMQDYNWLGDDTKMIYTSRYDDIANGIDSVAQLMKPEETWNIGMEIDFTSSESERKDKIRKIADKIAGGHISSVKYFDSPSTGKIKKMKMPKIAFGTSLNEMTDFVEIVSEAYVGKNPDSARAELRKHKMRDKFIELAYQQLKVFGSMAEQAGNEGYARMHSSLVNRFRERKLIK